MFKRYQSKKKKFDLKEFVRKAVKVLVIIFVICGSIYCAGFLYLKGKYTVPIMMYHSVNTVPREYSPTMDPDVFQEHIKFLKDFDYDVISADELIAGIQGKRKLSKKTVVITFDDGHVDNYQAAKVLAQYGFPALFFVPSSKVDTEGHLTWEQLSEMVSWGMTIGSHGHDELYLPEHPQAVQKAEIVNSKEIFERNLGVKINYYSYPIGGFSDEIKRMVKDAGYKGAFATNRGYDRFNKNVFELNRIHFGNKDNSRFILWAKLSGYYNLFRKLQNPY